jgi:hypothetical protein
MSILLLATGLLGAAAQAASPADFPFATPLPMEACPGGEGRVCRFVVPALARSPADPADASDHLVVDAAGAAVPAAFARGLPAPDEESVWARLSSEAHRYVVDAEPRPLEAFRVDLNGAGLSAATVTVYGPDGAVVGGPTLLWKADFGAQERVFVRPSAGPWEIALDWHTPPPRVSPDFTGERGHFLGAAAAMVPATVSGPVLEEDGWARLTVDLPSPLPARSLHLDVVGEVLDRAVVVRTTARAPGEFLSEEARIRRVRVGGASLEQTAIALPEGLAAGRFFVYIDCRGGAPLEVRGATAELPGLHLLVKSPPPGPLTLLSGAPPGAAPPGDLQAAIAELTRMAAPPVALPAPAPNPDYVPPEIQSAVALPGAALDGVPFTVQAVVRAEGGGGLVRIPVPRELRARARADLADLRLRTPSLQQVPYLLRRTGAVDRRAADAVERREDGSRSLLTVAVPTPSLAVSRVELETKASVFSRRVTLSRPVGASLEPLRSFEWVGSERPGRLVLDLDRVVGDTLVIEIDNGDDAPLPVDAVLLGWDEVELVAHVPAEGVVLLAGAPRLDPPDYDLALLGDDLNRRALQVAGLGPVEEIAPPAPAPLDRALVLSGVALLVAGLGYLTLRLLRGLPAAPEGGDAAPSAP